MRDIQVVRDQNKAKLTPIAHAVRFAMRCGITSPADLAAELECTQSAIYRAMKQLKDADRTVTESDATVKSDRTELTVQSESDATVTNTDRTVTHARVEYNNKLTSLVETPVDIKNPLPPKNSRAKPKFSRGDALKAFEAYNAVALRCGLPQASSMTPDRERKIIARLKDYGPDGWAKALANIEKSAFLTGGTDHGFRADLEFVCQAKSFGKLHDGGYGNGRHSKPVSFNMGRRAETEVEREARIQAAAERFFA